ncbi:hypothetical protein MTR_4g060580 [Medicago truncatula]|uniref:Uncharacterized protein n=2 Tax=Medicago truncatula TaxID=3880 RepID=G7JQG7_MEDTR|nr:hypothetical protein MTR_4g060580 [Medicago truncatula]
MEICNLKWRLPSLLSPFINKASPVAESKTSIMLNAPFHHCSDLLILRSFSQGNRFSLSIGAKSLVSMPLLRWFELLAPKVIQSQLYKIALAYVRMGFMDVPMVTELELIPDTMSLDVNKFFAIRTYEHGSEENNISEIKVLQ